MVTRSGIAEAEERIAKSKAGTKPEAEAKLADQKALESKYSTLNGLYLKLVEIAHSIDYGANKRFIEHKLSEYKLPKDDEDISHYGFAWDDKGALKGLIDLFTECGFNIYPERGGYVEGLACKPKNVDSAIEKLTALTNSPKIIRDALTIAHNTAPNCEYEAKTNLVFDNGQPRLVTTIAYCSEGEDYGLSLNNFLSRFFPEIPPFFNKQNPTREKMTFETVEQREQLAALMATANHPAIWNNARRPAGAYQYDCPSTEETLKLLSEAGMPEEMVRKLAAKAQVSTEIVDATLQALKEKVAVATVA